MLVRDFMTADVVTVGPDTRAAEALELMTRFRIRRLPVVHDGILVGIVARGDLLQVPLAALGVALGPDGMMRDLTVRHVMTPQTVTVAPDLTIEETAVLMRDHKIGALPVVEHDALVGIITESDVFDALIGVLGLRSGGTRLTIKQDNGQQLEPIIQTVRECGARVLSLSAYRLDGSNWIVVRVDAAMPLHLIQALVEHGVNVVHLASLPGRRTAEAG
jgi:acetoin utilization protein AcuB